MTNRYTTDPVTTSDGTPERIRADRLCWADGRDLVVYVLAPALLLWALMTGLGYLIVGPLARPLAAEDTLNRWVAAHRSDPWNAVTATSSSMGSTTMVVAAALLIFVLVWWRMQDWRLAVTPLIAVAVQLCIYLGVTALIRRERPPVERLEALLPMSSYPSGHVGASVALYLSLILITRRIQRAALRRALTIVAVVVPIMVALGRFYRGMHHLSDILAGAMIGVGCALLAHNWYRHRTAQLNRE